MPALWDGSGLFFGGGQQYLMKETVTLLRQWLEEATYPVAFTGAGISTDSGLNDFRSADKGVYNQGTTCGVPAEKILTPEFYHSHPAEFFDFYRTRLLDLRAAPNYIHYAMADMEACGRLRCVITQNADNLHQRAGSRYVIDFHGNVYENACETCGKTFPPTAVADCDGVPRCGCGGIIRPGILLFGEIPDMTKVMALVRELRKSDLLLATGSSLRVSSAHRLLDGYQGKLVILNRDPTPYDDRAALVIHEELRPVFETLWPLD